MFEFAPSFGDQYGVNKTVYTPVFNLSFTKQNREQKSTRVNSIARRRALFLLVNTDNDIVGLTRPWISQRKKERNILVC